MKLLLLRQRGEVAQIGLPRLATRHHALYPVLNSSITIVLLCCMAAPARARYEDPQPPLDRCWVPYVATPETLGLFHCDEHESTVSKRTLESLEVDIRAIANEHLDTNKPPPATLSLEGAGVDDAGKPVRSPASEGAAGVASKDLVLDASQEPRAGMRVGGAHFVPDGRFDGAIRLVGDQSAFRLPPYPAITSGAAFTIDAWIKPDAASKKASEQIIFHVTNQKQQGMSFELRRRSDGHLYARVGTAASGMSRGVAPAGQWTHIAMTLTPPRGVAGRFSHVGKMLGSQIILSLNGTLDSTFDDPAIAAAITKELRRSNGQVFVGNDPAGGAGFAGALDEVRVSKGIRDACPDQRTKFFATVGPAVGPPAMRDPADLVLHESFDQAAQQEQADIQSEGAVRGSCRLIGAGHTVLTTPLDASVDLSRGSLEVWLRADDWDNRQSQSLQRPLFTVPILSIIGQTGGQSKPILVVQLHSMKPLGQNPLSMQPGQWHHFVMAWGNGTPQAFFDGEPLPGGLLSWSIDSSPDAISLPLRTLYVGTAEAGGAYRGEKTFVDELRLYRRPMTADEARNAYARFVPGGRVSPLPFAWIDWGLNAATKSMTAVIDILDPRRQKVARVEMTVTGPDFKHTVWIEPQPLAATPTVAVGPRNTVSNLVDGRATVSVHNLPVGYGQHVLGLRFLDAAGTVIDEQSITRQRPIPPWLGSKVGIHEGEVLPGFDPLKTSANKDGHLSVFLSDRRIDIDDRGWPSALVSKGADMLAGPVEIEAKAGGEPLVWKSRAAQPVLEETAPDRVQTAGGMTAGTWSIDTQVGIQFDGMMKITARVASSIPGTLDRLLVTIPLKPEHATLFGFWTGHPEFRHACRYGATPVAQGTVLASANPGAVKNGQLFGSFIPFVALADDQRGLNWFAENDRHWTQSVSESAVVVERQPNRVVLRLLLVHEPIEVHKPLDYVFGLQLTPVKRLPANHRSLPRSVSFAHVDSFSKQDLKVDNGHSMQFSIAPENDDFDAAADRSQMHRSLYAKEVPYGGPILYLDRQYIGLPQNAAEYAPVWYRGGGFQYLPEAQDCYAWAINEWLARKLIAGLYIDDVWITPSTDPSIGLAYQFPDGRVQPGFDFFRYHALLKRLRWLFHDNGVEPLIWLHMTNTFYMPCLSFADILLDGESAFPNWGEERDFLRTWPMDRLRYNNPEKWGIATNWMFKIGLGDGPAPNAGLRHFGYQQMRALYAGLMVHDVAVQYRRIASLDASGVFDDAARFVGYWSPEAAVATTTPAVYASAYCLDAATPPRAVLVIVNRSGQPTVANLTVDAARLGFKKLPWSRLEAKDIDLWLPPPGEDLRKLVKPNPLLDRNILFDATTDLIDRLQVDIDQLAAAKGKFIFDESNHERTPEGFRVRVRPWDYRLIELRPAGPSP